MEIRAQTFYEESEIRAAIPGLREFFEEKAACENAGNGSFLRVRLDVNAPDYGFPDALATLRAHFPGDVLWARLSW